MRLLKKQSAASIALICLPKACLARQQLQRDRPLRGQSPMHYYSGYLCLPGFTREHRKRGLFLQAYQLGPDVFLKIKLYNA